MLGMLGWVRGELAGCTLLHVAAKAEHSRSNRYEGDPQWPLRGRRAQTPETGRLYDCSEARGAMDVNRLGWRRDLNGLAREWRVCQAGGAW